MSKVAQYLKPEQAKLLKEAPAALREAMLDALGEAPWIRRDVLVRYAPPEHTGPNTNLMPLAPIRALGMPWGEFAVDFVRPPEQEYADPDDIATLHEHDVRLVPLSERPEFFDFDPDEDPVWVPPPICHYLGHGATRAGFYACTEEAFEAIHSFADADISWRHVPLPQPSNLVGDLYLFEVRQTRCVDYAASDVTWKTIPLGRSLDKPVYVVPSKLHVGTVFHEDVVRGRHLVQVPGGQTLGETFASPDLIEALQRLGATTFCDNIMTDWFEGDE